MTKIQQLFKNVFTRLQSKRLLLAMSVVVVSVVGSYAAVAMMTPVGASLAREQLQPVDQPIEIILSPTVRHVQLDKISITPEVEGRWRLEDGAIGQPDRLFFDQAKPLIVDTLYQIDLQELVHLAGSSQAIPGLKVRTEKAPSLTDHGLAQLQEGGVIAADYPLEVELASKNRGLRSLKLRTKPKLSVTSKIVADQNYSWDYKGLLPQGKQIILEIFDENNQQTLLKRTVKVATVPSLKSKVKATYYTPEDMATLEFNQPIDERSRKHIDFSVAGEGSWTSDRQYQFKPLKPEPGKRYSYVLKKGMRTKDGGILEKDKTYYFQTTGAVSAYSPYLGAEVSQKSQTVKFIFDQAVDRKSAEERVGVSHGQLNGMSWQGNTLAVGLKNLGYQKNVTVKLVSGIKNAQFGLPSQQTFTSSFTTEARTKHLNVPHYRQARTGTCAPASLRMALAFYGIQRDEMTLVRDMGYKPRNMNRDKTPNEWDDPAKMFVGRVDGTTYYELAGPDAPPVAKAAIANGRSAQAVRGISAEWIARQIHDGHPVIMFGATKATGFKTWRTPTGGTAKMNLSSHATVVTGVKGEAHAPIGFWVNDPLAGGTTYWSVDMVRTNIARDAYRQAVVVF